ncbi:MAG: site-specific integrase [Planctomycetaceae bacterium]|nr:site-specific integrase [Planctomycetaceae bacterium]
MPRQKNASPSYLLHQRSGQARVRLTEKDGRCREHYLGPYGSPESWEKYHRLVAEHLQESGNDVSDAAKVDEDLSIAELVVEYDEFSREYYVKDGEITNDRFRAVVSPLVSLYGSTPAREFGPNKLRTVREHIIARGHAGQAEYDERGKLLEPGEPLSRKYVNALIQDLARMFKWGVSRELLPASVYDSLRAVEGIRKGKDNRLREAAPVKPVPEEHFDAVVAAACPQIATMLQVQRLAGMRPDELTIMRPRDIERTRDVWIYRPESHKLDWQGIDKEILLGPQAQTLLGPWLEGRDEDAYLFSPKEVAEASYLARRTREKKKPRKSRRKRPPREHYSDDSYRRAVQRVCKAIGIPSWSPGRLRHNAGTQVREAFGVEAAQLVLGHRKLSTTEIYAEKSREKYEEIIREVG